MSFVILPLIVYLLHYKIVISIIMTVREGVWRVKFPRSTPWSTITYSRIKRPLRTIALPANAAVAGLVVLRADKIKTFCRIPPGESPWQTRVRIIGSKSAETSSSVPSIVDLTDDSEPTSTLTVTASGDKKVPSITKVPKIILGTTSGIPRIVVENADNDIAPVESSPPTKTESTGTVNMTHVDMVNDLDMICHGPDGVENIQLHFTCQGFPTVRETYDALTKIPDLSIIMGTQTTTEKCTCRDEPRTTKRQRVGSLHRNKTSPNTHIEAGPYEVSVRSRNTDAMLSAAKVCRDVARRTTTKCEIRLSTTIHTYG